MSSSFSGNAYFTGLQKAAYFSDLNVETLTADNAGVTDLSAHNSPFVGTTLKGYLPASYYTTTFTLTVPYHLVDSDNNVIQVPVGNNFALVGINVYGSGVAPITGTWTGGSWAVGASALAASTLTYFLGTTNGGATGTIPAIFPSALTINGRYSITTSGASYNNSADGIGGFALASNPVLLTLSATAGTNNFLSVAFTGGTLTTPGVGTGTAIVYVTYITYA